MRLNEKTRLRVEWIENTKETGMDSTIVIVLVLCMVLVVFLVGFINSRTRPRSDRPRRSDAYIDVASHASSGQYHQHHQHHHSGGTTHHHSGGSFGGGHHSGGGFSGGHH